MQWFCVPVGMTGPCLRKWRLLAVTSLFRLLWGFSTSACTSVPSLISIFELRWSLMLQWNLKFYSLVSNSYWKFFLVRFFMITPWISCSVRPWNINVDQSLSPRPFSQSLPLYGSICRAKMDAGWLSAQQLMLFLQPTCPGSCWRVCLESLGSISLLIMEATQSEEFYSSPPARLGSSLQSVW